MTPPRPFGDADALTDVARDMARDMRKRDDPLGDALRFIEEAEDCLSAYPNPSPHGRLCVAICHVATVAILEARIRALIGRDNGGRDST
jgi:hypothetical protein